MHERLCEVHDCVRKYVIRCTKKRVQRFQILEALSYSCRIEKLIINVNHYKGKGDFLERGNYRELKSTDQIPKVAEKITEKLIRQQVGIYEMQFGFMLGRGNASAIFILRQ